MTIRKFVLTSILVMFLVSMCSFVHADILRVPERYDTIQDAIDAADDDDIVLVDDGTYEESINFSGKAITVRSENGPHNTKIISPDNSSTIVFTSGEVETSVIEGFCLMLPAASINSQIYCQSSSPLITKNIITVGPIGINVEDGGSPLIINNTIVGNRKQGIRLEGERTSPIIKNNIIVGNWSGIYAFNGADPIIDYNNVWDNASGGYRGSRNYTSCSAGQNDISEDSMFAAYEANVSAGESIQEAIYNITYFLGENSPCIGVGENEVNIGAYPEQNNYEEPGELIIIVGSGEFQEDIRISGYVQVIGSDRNNSRILGQVKSGGSSSHIANLTITAQNRHSSCISASGFNSTIEHNTLIGGRCGINSGEYSKKILNNRIINSSLHAISIPWRGDGIEIKNNRIVNCGKAIEAQDWLNIVISNNIIIGCESHGAAIRLIGYAATEIKVVNNTIIDGEGDGIYLSISRRPENLFVENNIIVNNQGFGIYIHRRNDQEVLTDYNDVWDNAEGNYGGDAEAGDNDISEDPLFVDAEAGHYSLDEDSPCIDAGNPDEQYNDPDGTRNDIGAFYFRQEIEQTIELTEGWNIVSFNVVPDSMDMEDIFTPIIEDLLMVKDEAGLFWTTEWNFSNLPPMDNREGYQVKVARDCELTIEGTPVELPLRISLPGRGWSIIGYPCQEAQSARDLIEESLGDIPYRLKDEDGNFIASQWNYYGIEDLLPGKGYQMWVPEDVDLIITAPE